MTIDWNLVTQIVGLGFLVLIIVVGVLSLVVWLVNIIVRKILVKNISDSLPNSEINNK